MLRKREEKCFDVDSWRIPNIFYNIPNFERMIGSLENYKENYLKITGLTKP